jgi:coenzyme F420-reducing hydrogenase delta subunit
MSGLVNFTAIRAIRAILAGDADAKAVRSGNDLVMHGGGHDAWCSFIVGKQHWRCGPRTWND